MAAGTYFVKPCPTCGRKLEVRIELLGREVECVHCSAVFTANERVDTGPDELKINRLIAKAQEYIDSTANVNAATSE